jgi:hypothetical protein
MSTLSVTGVAGHPAALVYATVIALLINPAGQADQLTDIELVP